MSNFGSGAYDLSSLRKKPTTDASGPATPATGAPASGPQVAVASLITLANEANLRDFLNLSSTLPVVVEVFSSQIELSKSVSAKLGQAIAGLAGRAVLLRVDIDATPQISTAFQVNVAPTVLAMVQGQPLPLFSGDADQAQIDNVLRQLVDVAAKNGVSGTAVVDETMPANAPAEPAIPPQLQAAFEAIDAGEYQSAVDLFEAALASNPGDQMAKAGAAQSKLLVRTDGLDIAAIVSSTPSDAESRLQKGDVLVAIGSVAEGLNEILDAFAAADKDQREPIRQRLLELFEVAGTAHPAVTAARGRLASLLY